MKQLRKHQIIGLLATALFHAVLIVVLVLGYLFYSYPPKDEDLKKYEKEEILFGGEYVTYGDNLKMTSDKPAAPEVEQPKEKVVEKQEVVKEEVTAEAKPNLTTSAEESPMKEEERLRQEEQARQEEEARKIRNRVSFGKSKSSGEGNTGAEVESEATNAMSGTPGVTGLVGYTLESWGRPRSSKTGTVVVRVRVNARGAVVQANAVRGTGNAWTDMTVRERCVEESKKSRFSVPENKTTEGVGEIVWRFN